MINVRKNIQDFYQAWKRYCAVKNWREAGNHVDWGFEVDGDTSWIYFQGSSEGVDWIRNCMAWPALSGDSWIHAGFLLSFRDWMRDCSAVHEGMIKPTTNVVGFSAGGALAILFTDLFQVMKWCTINCYTFAAPRVAWARPLAPQPNTVNVRLSGDPIPHLPPRWLGWRDNPGETIVLPSKFGFQSHQPKMYDEIIQKEVDSFHE